MSTKKLYRTCVAVMLSFLAGACLDKYDPPVSDNDIGYIVIDGFMNTTTKTVTVKITRAIALSASEAIPAVLNANVIIEGEDGSKATLIEKTAGNYELTSPLFANPTKFKLTTTLSDGKRYESNYVQPLATPVIDSVTWKPKSGGVTMYVNSHDDTNQTRYYKWNFTETWMYSTPFFSFFRLQGGQAVLRKPDEYINTCWGTEKSSTILIGSTLKLSKDIVRDFPLTTIERGSRKVSERYSILVEQRALDVQAYDYWEKLQKTSETLGGLFDPLPSQITGNIRSMQGDKEPVLGYFSAGAVQQKRFYIRFADLPDYLLMYNFNVQCETANVAVSELGNLGGDKVLLESYGQPVTVGYTYTNYECADCRTYGGTTTNLTSGHDKNIFIFNSCPVIQLWSNCLRSAA